MLGNINLKDFPKESGVYWILDENNVVVYVGSSNDLARRMRQHKSHIKNGSNDGYQTDLYQFLQSNQFKIEYTLEENYRQKEQELIKKYQPKFNLKRAFAGLKNKRSDSVEYNREWREKFKEEIKQKKKQYYEEHKSEILEKAKQKGEYYRNRLCNYNGEILTFEALRSRLRYKGVEHPNIEAKKYLIK